MPTAKSLKRVPTRKYLVNALLAVFTIDQQKKVMHQIIKHGVSQNTLYTIMRSEIKESYSAKHDNLQTIYNVLANYNPVFKSHLGIELNAVDDLKVKLN